MSTPTFTPKQVALEIQSMTGRLYDPGYISNVRNGTRVSGTLSDLIAKAEANLAARASSVLPRVEAA